MSEPAVLDFCRRVEASLITATAATGSATATGRRFLARMNLVAQGRFHNIVLPLHVLPGEGTALPGLHCLTATQRNKESQNC